VHDKTIDANLFYTRFEWSNNLKEFLKTWQLEDMLLV
jgi:hypothetical protein